MSQHRCLVERGNFEFHVVMGTDEGLGHIYLTVEYGDYIGPDDTEFDDEGDGHYHNEYSADALDGFLYHNLAEENSFPRSVESVSVELKRIGIILPSTMLAAIANDLTTGQHEGAWEHFFHAPPSPCSWVQL